VSRLTSWVVLLLALLTPDGLRAQAGTGRITGRVLEATRGAPVAMAVVELVGLPQPRRTNASVDGRFSFTGVPAGEVAIRVKAIGYGPKLISGVRVPAGGVVTQDVSLSPEAVQLAELNVTAEAERGSVVRAIEEERTAPQIINTIGVEQIEKSPDSDAGQAVQRVSGVTVQDGKYIFVRGLGERYTTTSLNGARIPSTEPERRVVPLDLFPSSLLDGISTAKTFTADQPGDFSGAQVNLKTREFPAERYFAISFSAGFNDAATGKTILRAPTTGREWLGFAGSARAIPGVVDRAGSLAGLSQTELNTAIASFRNAWSASSARGAPNGGGGLAFGGEDPFFGQPVGYIASLTYSYGQEIRDNETRGLAVGDATGTRPFNTYTGQSARNTALWGGVLNLSTRLGGTSKIGLNNTYTRGADNEASRLVGFNEEFGHNFDITRLLFVERSVRSNQLLGEHRIGNRSFVEWSASNSKVTRDEPDRSDLVYLAGTNEWFAAPRSATRTFSDLSENAWETSASYRLTIGKLSNPGSFKFGGLHRHTNRDANSRAYDIVNIGLPPGAARQGTPEEVLSDAHAAAGNFTAFANQNAGFYQASERIVAGFAQIDIPLGRRVQLITGARLERWELNVLSRGVTGQLSPARPRNTDLLPSVALNVRLTDDQNLRFSATQTLSRPEYRELSTVPYFEQVGLLTTQGNPDLKRALIQNFDVRWELFPTTGEVISIGAFAKRFNNPIEKVIVLGPGTNILSFVNAEDATNYGVELELRKSLGFMSLEPFTVFANTTLMNSEITPGNSGISALTNENRPMVGQSEYVVNAGLGYAHPKGAFDATALYNVSGRRILEAGTAELPDAYEEARHLFDVAVRFNVSDRLSFKVDAKNLLDSPFELTQGTVTRQRYHLGRTFAVGATWRP